MKVHYSLIIVFFFFPIFLFSQSSLTERQKQRLYNPSWVPPPVIATPKKSNTSETSVTTEKDKNQELPAETYTTMEELKKLLEEQLNKNFLYPVQAKKRHIQGSIKLLLEISEKGNLLSYKIEGQNSDILKRSALKTVQKSFPLKVNLKQSVSNFPVTITYKIE